MSTRTLAAAALLLLSSTSALAQSSSFDAWTVQCGTSAYAHVEVSGTPFELYAVYTGPADGPLVMNRPSLLHRGRFDANGRDSFEVQMPGYANLPMNIAVRLHLLTRSALGLTAQSVFLPLTGSGGTLCQEFDPNYSNGPSDPVPGMPLSTQWGLVGLSMSAQNNVLGHPDMALVFDSANPTGGDTDLATPGYGPGNTTALGNLIIVAENDIDLNMDGLVDDPDDEHDGGVIRFDFGDPFRMCSATLVDIDEAAGAELRFYIGAAMTLETIPVPAMGDNSVQTIMFDKLDVRRFEVAFSGSGAIGRLGMIPCPMMVDLDETPFGKPLGLAAGSEITNQFASLGLTISAMNNDPTHPDKAILFDSANPTGGDFDLETPGYGVNNTEALGMVLIIAENDVDMNGDGLVDDPDDEFAGGQFEFVFSETVTFFSALVLDVDGQERDVFTFFDEANLPIDIIEIDALGDNSVQMLTSPTPITGVKRISANFTGSGALARLRWCPDSNHN